MAKRISMKELKELPVTPYEKIRDQLLPGDLFFSSGEYLVSKLIQKFTHSAFSHVGIIFPVKSLERVLLLESVEDKGVRFAPLSKYLTDYEHSKPYKGIILTARVTGIDKKKIEEIAKFGIDELTRSYDKAEIGRIVSRIALNKGKKTRDKEYICSELVYECFLKAGTEFQYDKRGFISPENLWEDPRVELLGRVL